MEKSANHRLKMEAADSPQEGPDFAADVAAGLARYPKTIPSLYFYDRDGSLLFEQICALPEYYLTRAEEEILLSVAARVAGYSSGTMTLVEFGSGSSLKTRLLIEALITAQGSLHYLPIDISRSMLEESSLALLESYPRLRVTAWSAEYQAGLARISQARFEQKMVLFLGSNIGNLRLDRAVRFLSDIGSQLQPRDLLLLGTDLQKDATLLESAYNDSAGVTARFNRNLLLRINRELDGNFVLDRFAHLAFYNPAYTRIEMHLKSRDAQSVTVGGQRYSFLPGETIHTENSYKYSFQQLEEIFSLAGLRLVEQWVDSGRRFALSLLGPDRDE